MELITTDIKQLSSYRICVWRTVVNASVWCIDVTKNNNMSITHIWTHDNQRAQTTIQSYNRWLSLIAGSHCRHGQDKTVLSCLVPVGGVNTTGNKTRQFCLVSTQFPICNCSASNIMRTTADLENGWVETKLIETGSRRDKTFLQLCSHNRHGQDETILSCLVHVGGVYKL